MEAVLWKVPSDDAHLSLESLERLKCAFKGKSRGRECYVETLTGVWTQGHKEGDAEYKVR